MAEFSFAQYQESADYLSARLGGFRPEVLLILGSGLGYLADQVEDPLAVPYEDIPHFARSTAPGHAGRFVFGLLRGRRVAVMQGRFHYYEGYNFPQVTYPVRVLRLLGAETMIVTNAAGCVNTAWPAGTLMVMDDHIKLALDSPLRGENLPQFGPRFPDSGQVYTPALRALAGQVAAKQGIPVEHGVYLFMPGPQYETPAEIRAARLLGADAVGMSTVPEAVVASHAGMGVLGISLLTNMAAGILDTPLSEEEVLTAAEAGREKFSALVLGCLERME
ncbi:MAG: purine-nucleoside phosphorylase [Clostridiales bacterium]|nr:purine-nucleoside phosphorylase [Clostridiales bacterium]